jgi:hypothetical protein
MNTQMTVDKISKRGRILAVSPTQAGIIRRMPEVQDASKSGMSESSAISGLVAKVEGFIVVECQGLSANQVMFLGASAYAEAFWDVLEREEQRNAEKKSTFCSQDFHYEASALYDGAQIYFGDNNA